MGYSGLYVPVRNEDAAKQDICKCGLFKVKGEEGEEV